MLEWCDGVGDWIGDVYVVEGGVGVIIVGFFLSSVILGELGYDMVVVFMCVVEELGGIDEEKVEVVFYFFFVVVVKVVFVCFGYSGVCLFMLCFLCV